MNNIPGIVHDAMSHLMNRNPDVALYNMINKIYDPSTPSYALHIGRLKTFVLVSSIEDNQVLEYLIHELHEKGYREQILTLQE